MKAPLKITGIALLAVIVLVLIAFFSLDSLIEKGVETVGSRSLGVEVKLKRAHLSILKRRLTISGLEISNPEGFKTDSLFKVERASMAVRPLSLFKVEIAVEAIVLNSPSLTIEQSASGTNLSKVLGNIEDSEPKQGGADDAGPEKTYRIKLLRLKDAKVTFSSFLTAKAPATVPLPDIEMKNISSEDGTGLVLAQVIKQVLVKMVRTGVAEGGGIVPTDMMQGITGDLRDVVPGLAGDTGGIVEKAKGALRGLLGR